MNEYCKLPLTDPRFSYTPSHMQTPEKLAETFRRHEPIRVSPIRDDYENVQSFDWLEPGGFK